MEETIKGEVTNIISSKVFNDLLERFMDEACKRFEVYVKRALKKQELEFKRRDEAQKDKYEILSVNAACKMLHIGKEKLHHAFALYDQSGGRAGLAYIPTPGNQRRVRSSVLKAYFESLEKESINS